MPRPRKETTCQNPPPRFQHLAPRLPVELIIAAGCAIAILSFGPRSSIGAFQRDVLVDNGWTRDVFSLAIALQNLLWGLGQPLAGGFADSTARRAC